MTTATETAVSSAVLGLGVTGLSCVRHLHGLGHRVTAMDTRPEPPALAQVRRDFPDVNVITGSFDAGVVETVELIAVSPGIPADDPLLEQARAQSVDVAGDIELFARAARGRIAAVTGTNGKSTVTSLLGAILLAAGRDVAVGGNLGTPALELLEQNPEDGYVLELSSFQLDLTRTLRADCAALLNLSPDHLDRYGTLEAYAASKRRIFTGARVAVFNADEPATRPPADFDGLAVGVHMGPPPSADGWGVETGADGKRWLVGQGRPLIPAADLPVAGRHNEFNVLCALAMASALDVSPEQALPAVRAFQPLPHRCTPVGEIAGVRFVDDSKATNVGACRAAVEGLGEARRNLVVILGGQGKGADFGALREPFERCVKAAVLIGTEAAAIGRELEGVCALEHAGDMETAVATAFGLAQPGDIVLLAPACASFDMFASYVERGEHFIAAVRKLGEGRA